MKSRMTAIAAALAAVAAAPAFGQAAPATGAEGQPLQPTITPSAKAHQAILDLQQAVNTNDVANIPAKAAAAEAVAETAEDRYLIAALRFQAAKRAKDDAGTAAAIEALLASGKAAPVDVTDLTHELALAYHRLKQHDKAAAMFERVLASEPNNSAAMVMFAETRQAQGRSADAISLIRRAIAAAEAGGAKADEKWYRRALAIAYNAELPVSVELSRAWLAAYPSEESWRDALRVYRKIAAPNDGILLDTLRLARATGALEGEAEFKSYGYLTITEGYPGEAKAMLEEAIAARKIDAAAFKDYIAEANSKSAGERATLDEAARSGHAATEAKRAVTTGDLLYGYGEYAKAAELYRAALGKANADKDLINLRLGMALARSGDKAAATAALNAVGGPRAELAKFWLVYVDTRA